MVTPQAAHISGALYAVKKKVTFDTNAKPTDRVVEAAIAAGCYVTYASVSLREAGDTDFEVELKKYDRVPELAVWDESDWNEARWADEPSSERLENILNVISNGSFPKISISTQTATTATDQSSSLLAVRNRDPTSLAGSPTLLAAADRKLCDRPLVDA